VSRFAQYVLTLFQNQVFYGILYFILVIAFTWFSTSIFFQPKKIAENLQKNGGFIPGIRPGLHTEEFLVQTMNRIIPAGAIFLAAVAVMPFIAQSLTGIATIALGGTSILIVVSVVIDTVKKIQGKMVSLNYDNM
jgi:preprotein translocase subunit SecY